MLSLGLSGGLDLAHQNREHLFGPARRVVEEMKRKVKDLGFEISAGQMGCYVPPCTQMKWLMRCGFMEAAGDRWWPMAGGVYFVQAVKRVRGMRLIMPKWSDRLAPKKNLAATPAPEKVGKTDEPLAARTSIEQQ